MKITSQAQAQCISTTYEAESFCGDAYPIKYLLKIQTCKAKKDGLKRIVVVHWNLYNFIKYGLSFSDP